MVGKGPVYSSNISLYNVGESLPRPLNEVIQAYVHLRG